MRAAARLSIKPSPYTRSTWLGLAWTCLHLRVAHAQQQPTPTHPPPSEPHRRRPHRASVSTPVGAQFLPEPGAKCASVVPTMCCSSAKWKREVVPDHKVRSLALSLVRRGRTKARSTSSQRRHRNARGGSRDWRATCLRVQGTCVRAPLVADCARTALEPSLLPPDGARRTSDSRSLARWPRCPSASTADTLDALGQARGAGAPEGEVSLRTPEQAWNPAPLNTLLNLRESAPTCSSTLSTSLSSTARRSARGSRENSPPRPEREPR